MVQPQLQRHSMVSNWNQWPDPNRKHGLALSSSVWLVLNWNDWLVLTGIRT